MTNAERRITDELLANTHPVKLFWDMDGTCCSMEMHLKEYKLTPGFFANKRPIKTILAIISRLNQLGAETYILSFCGYYFQKMDKLAWLNKYLPFVPLENTIIIPRRETDVRKAETKQKLKALYLRDYISDGDIVYYIDDNESVLLGTKEELPSINIVSPIDFIE